MVGRIGSERELLIGRLEETFLLIGGVERGSSGFEPGGALENRKGTWVGLKGNRCGFEREMHSGSKGNTLGFEKEDVGHVKLETSAGTTCAALWREEAPSEVKTDSRRANGPVEWRKEGRMKDPTRGIGQKWERMGQDQGREGGG